MANNDQARDVAESSFKKKQRRLLEAQKAMAEHNVAIRAEDAKTARLKALRLARDAELAAAPPPVKPAKASRAKKKKAAVPAPAAAAVEPAGDKQLSPQDQSHHLEMAERDGSRAETVSNPFETPNEKKPD